jgi:hypothetical protein
MKISVYTMAVETFVAIGKRDYASWVGAFIRPKAT